MRSGSARSLYRSVAHGAACAVLALGAAWHHQAGAFGFENVAQRARQLAEAPFREAAASVPAALRDLDAARYRDIRYRPERALWKGAGLAFELQFFHPGRHFDRPVRINEITSEGIRRMRFRPGLFDYGGTALKDADLAQLGFAGFRVHYPLNSNGRMDEVLSFLGATYFRALGSGQRYGLSARAVAIDTGLASGEEFPRFIEFWIERPAPRARHLVIHALLDSRSLSGAFRFVLRPGTETVLEVKGRLYLREPVEKLGLAPLTSMFLFGENQHRMPHEYRPEVHDSDGLSLRGASGEWIWRPLVNPARLLVTSFDMPRLRGFGLMQRDRLYASYQDPEHRYDLRPAAWVEPQRDWGPGRVELVQIPVPNETNDNIVAYWVPQAPPQPQRPIDVEYRVLWQGEHQTVPRVARVLQSRRGTPGEDGSQQFVLDFVGAEVKESMPESAVWVDANGTLLQNSLRRNEVTGGWRVVLRVRPVDAKKPVELRALLRSGNTALSETWSYVLPAR